MSIQIYRHTHPHAHSCSYTYKELVGEGGRERERNNGKKGGGEIAQLIHIVTLGKMWKI